MKTAVFFPRRARHLGPSRGSGLARCWYASRRRDLRFGSATRSPRATDTEYPIRAGHELSGEVVAAGPDVTTLQSQGEIPQRRRQPMGGGLVRLAGPPQQEGDRFVPSEHRHWHRAGDPAPHRIA